MPSSLASLNQQADIRKMPNIGTGGLMAHPMAFRVTVKRIGSFRIPDRIGQEGQLPSVEIGRPLQQLLHGRPHPGRFHVRGFNEQGTTTTPFDMVVMNRMSRYHLALEALRRARRAPAGGAELEEHCEAMLARHHDYVREHLEDMPEVRDWTWDEA